jgi:transcriptional regulator with XRE-family HTH domain
MRLISPEILRKLMDDNNINQKQLADLLKVKPQTVAYYLSKGVKVIKFNKITEVLGINKEETDKMIKNQINLNSSVFNHIEENYTLREEETIYQRKNITDDLLTLSQLFEKKHLTLEEFNVAKSKILKN